MDVNGFYVDRLTMFLGEPVKITDNVFLYSPTIKEIQEIGESQYQLYLHFCSFDLKKIVVDLYGVSELEAKEIEKDQEYFLICSNKDMVLNICEGLSFFTKKIVTFEEEFLAFKCEKDFLINPDTYSMIAKIIQELNGVEKSKKEKLPTFPNKRVEEKYYKMLEKKKKALIEKNKKDGLQLKDVLSILCTFQGNGISIHNVKSLTIYQVYEQFERMGLKESHSRLLPIWAAGNLGEKTKLTEWLVKTKL